MHNFYIEFSSRHTSTDNYMYRWWDFQDQHKLLIRFRLSWVTDDAHAHPLTDPIILSVLIDLLQVRILVACSFERLNVSTDTIAFRGNPPISRDRIGVSRERLAISTDHVALSRIPTNFERLCCDEYIFISTDHIAFGEIEFAFGLVLSVSGFGSMMWYAKYFERCHLCRSCGGYNWRPKLSRPKFFSLVHWSPFRNWWFWTCVESTWRVPRRMPIDTETNRVECNSGGLVLARLVALLHVPRSHTFSKNILVVWRLIWKRVRLLKDHL